MKTFAPALAFLAASSMVRADATLVYELKDPASGTSEKTFAISHFFVRAESSDQTDHYLLFQAGKFFPVYRVNAAEATYVRLTPEVHPALGPPGRGMRSAEAAAADGGPPRDGAEESAPPHGPEQAPGAPSSPVSVAQTPLQVGPARFPKQAQFQATPELDEVAGIRCRVVLELIAGVAAIEHCMANKAALGITEREIRTFARLLVMARGRGLDWLGAATDDEEFVSVRSRDTLRGKTLTLTSISTAPLPVGHLRVPRNYREVTSTAAGEAGGNAPKGAAEAPAPAPGQPETPSSAD